RNPLEPPVVANRPPQVLDAGRQRRLRHEAGLPHVVEELLLRNHAITSLEEVDEHVVHLGFDTDDVAVPAELVGVGVELAAREQVDHVDSDPRPATAATVGHGTAAHSTSPRSRRRVLATVRSVRSAEVWTGPRAPGASADLHALPTPSPRSRCRVASESQGKRSHHRKETTRCPAAPTAVMTSSWSGHGRRGAPPRCSWHGWATPWPCWSAPSSRATRCRPTPSRVAASSSFPAGDCSIGCSPAAPPRFAR